MTRRTSDVTAGSGPIRDAVRVGRGLRRLGASGSAPVGRKLCGERPAARSAGPVPGATGTDRATAARAAGQPQRVLARAVALYHLGQLEPARRSSTSCWNRASRTRQATAPTRVARAASTRDSPATRMASIWAYCAHCVSRFARAFKPRSTSSAIRSHSYPFSLRMRACMLTAPDTVRRPPGRPRTRAVVGRSRGKSWHARLPAPGDLRPGTVLERELESQFLNSDRLLARER